MKSCSFLVVDDDDRLLFVMKRFFDSEGLPARFAESGEKALEMIKDAHFSMMITDFNMPGMNGFELTKRAKNISPAMPVIMVTGADSPEIPKLAAEAGVSRILYKPFEPSELIDVINSIIATCGKP
jgi:DNA-binding response OmpR family regulator